VLKVATMVILIVTNPANFLATLLLLSMQTKIEGETQRR